MRVSATAAALLSTVLVLLGAAPAYADPSFVLATSEATAGDQVRFSISSTDGDATYSLRIGGGTVAAGSDPDGEGVSGAFTMPDLGGADRTVTVEAHITQDEETTILTRALRYRARSQAPTAPTGTETAPAPSPTAPVQQGPPVAPGSSGQGSPSRGDSPGSRKRKRRGSRGPTAERPAQRSPARTRERSSSGERRSTEAGNRDKGRGSRKDKGRDSRKSKSRKKSGAAKRGKRRRGKERSTSSAAPEDGPRNGPPRSGLGLATPLTAPLFAPSASSPAAAVAYGGATLAAVVVLVMLGLVGLALVGMRLARTWRPAVVPDLVEEGDAEVLRGFVHVPRSGHPPRDG